MVMKNYKRLAEERVDPGLPTKPPAPPAGREPDTDTGDRPIPTGEGPVKSDRMPASAATSAAGKTAKPLFDAGATVPPNGQAPVEGFGDQRARSDTGPRNRDREPGESYIRMRIRLHDGRLSILDSNLVDGPLAQPTGFTGPHAYEVTLGDRLVHADSVPDLMVKRSFVNPEGPPEEQGHHITDLTDVEFTARVPADVVTPDSLGDMAVRLHRVKDEARADRLGHAPLAVQFERQIRPVAELVGLPESVLPEAIAARGGQTPQA